jgi:hypothetical protein
MYRSDPRVTAVLSIPFQTSSPPLYNGPYNTMPTTSSHKTAAGEAYDIEVYLQEGLDAGECVFTCSSTHSVWRPVHLPVRQVISVGITYPRYCHDVPATRPRDEPTRVRVPQLTVQRLRLAQPAF